MLTTLINIIILLSTLCLVRTYYVKTLLPVIYVKQSMKCMAEMLIKHEEKPSDLLAYHIVCFIFA